MTLPGELEQVLCEVRRAGRPLLVGGCVRDFLLGLDPHDFDVEVFDTDFDHLRQALEQFGPTDVVGKSFGVVKVRLAGREYDFSLPRRETKTGGGHRNFAVEPNPRLSFAEAAARRDFTINAIGYDPFRRETIDPHGGEKDLRARILRHVGPAFSEDPLRVLRGFQLAGRFDLTVAAETATLCREIRDSFHELPRERLWAEWEKWARLSVRPSRGLEVLKQTTWLPHFPEIAHLQETPQEPDWHPEGDVLTHTGHCLDALAQNREWKSRPAPVRRYLTLAVLAHDFGKARCTRREEKHGKQRWVSPGHDKAGGELAESFLRSIGAPRAVIEFVRPLTESHMYHVHSQGNITKAGVRRLARKLAPATIDDLCLVILADGAGRPPLPPTGMDAVTELRERARKLKVERQAPRPIILGRHLIDEGLKPGPHFKTILDDLFEAQLEGAFKDEQEGRAFLQSYLKGKRLL